MYYCFNTSKQFNKRIVYINIDTEEPNEQQFIFFQMAEIPLYFRVLLNYNLNRKSSHN